MYAFYFCFLGFFKSVRTRAVKAVVLVALHRIYFVDYLDSCDITVFSIGHIFLNYSLSLGVCVMCVTWYGLFVDICVFYDVSILFTSMDHGEEPVLFIVSLIIFMHT